MELFYLVADRGISHSGYLRTSADRGWLGYVDYPGLSSLTIFSRWEVSNNVHNYTHVGIWLLNRRCFSCSLSITKVILLGTYSSYLSWPSSQSLSSWWLHRNDQNPMDKAGWSRAEAISGQHRHPQLRPHPPDVYPPEQAWRSQLVAGIPD